MLDLSPAMHLSPFSFPAWPRLVPCVACKGWKGSVRSSGLLTDLSGNVHLYSRCHWNDSWTDFADPQTHELILTPAKDGPKLELGLLVPPDLGKVWIWAWTLVMWSYFQSRDLVGWQSWFCASQNVNFLLCAWRTAVRLLLDPFVSQSFKVGSNRRFGGDARSSAMEWLAEALFDPCFKILDVAII